jgi:hypothetical protein
MSRNHGRQLAKRRALGAGVPEDEVRRRLSALAVADQGIGVRAILGINRRASRLPAAEAIVEVARHYASKMGNKRRLVDVLSSWADRLSMGTWLADYQIEWYKTGSPPPLGEHLFGGVVEIALGPEADKVQIVVAMAGAASDPEAIAEDFLRQCSSTFPQSFKRKEHAERDAERVRRFENGESDFEIARDELEAEAWSLRAVNKREYNQGVRVRANSITHARKRWMEYVTQILESESPSSS